MLCMKSAAALLPPPSPSPPPPPPPPPSRCRLARCAAGRGRRAHEQDDHVGVLAEEEIRPEDHAQYQAAKRRDTI